MPTKETLSFNTETKTRSHEDLPSLHEQERLHGRGSLRHKLVTDFEGKGGHNHLPRGTVVVEANSADLSPESFFTMADKVTNLRSKYGATEQDAELYQRSGKTLLDVDREVTERREKGEPTNDLTFVYEGRYEQPKQGEIHVPSAALVHSENMSKEDIAKLRKTLPEGVPLLDAKTNHLLDETGSAERGRADHLRKVRTIMSDIALSQLVNFQFPRNTYSWISKPRFYTDEKGATYDATVGDISDVFGSHRNTKAKQKTYTRRYPTNGFGYATSNMDPSEAMNAASAAYTESGYGFAPNETPRQKSPTPEQRAILPESDEVRTHREKQEAQARLEAEIDAAHGEAIKAEEGRSIQKATGEILKNAKEMYDADNLSGLTDDELRRVQRRTQRNLHPDKGYSEGGDHGAFQEANGLLEKVKAEREAVKAATPEAKSDS